MNQSIHVLLCALASGSVSGHASHSMSPQPNLISLLLLFAFLHLANLQAVRQTDNEVGVDNIIDKSIINIKSFRAVGESGAAPLDPIFSDLMPALKNSSKRASWDFYAMIKCGTGCNPLVYKGYGCYCGFLGSGETVDEIDM